ncbi:MAG: sigma-70 family RNA polymerase sigma factor [Cyanobacteria bacterium]|nr:sigma-70 family RNA polymerase sigma factor [Cyanobacteriota bacterium]
MTTPRRSTTRVSITQFLPLVERVAKVEYRRIPSHMVDYEELVNIGAIAIQALFRNKSPEDIEKMNTSYMATAIRWAIRNELRTRYKWYTLKHNKEEEETPASTEGQTPEGATGEGATPGQTGHSPEQVREAVYETILSIDSIQEGSDGDTPYDFIKDTSATPDERLEITELGRAIKKAIANLPPKERTIMEYRFYRNMQVKDIASLVGLSSSRITRIVQASLNLVRDYLKENDHID